MRRHLLWASVVVGVGAACGGTGGDDILGDGGNDGSMNNDGNQNNDGEGVDTGMADTGGSDTGGDASCTGPDFCSSIKNPLFCSDFDMELMPTDWTTVTSGGGTVAIVQNEEVSCPNGLHSSVPMAATSTTMGPVAKVTKAITSMLSTTTHVVIDIEVYLPSNDTKSYVSFFGVRPTAEVGTGAYVTHHGDAFWFISTAGFANGNLNVAISPAPLTGAWNHMTLDVHFGSLTAGSATLTYTGADNMSHMVTGTGTTANAAVTGGVTLEAGMQVSGFTGAEAAFDAYYDNVVLQSGP